MGSTEGGTALWAVGCVWAEVRCGLKSALSRRPSSSVPGHVASGLGGIADGSGRGSWVLLEEVNKRPQGASVPGRN